MQSNEEEDVEKIKKKGREKKRGKKKKKREGKKGRGKKRKEREKGAPAFCEEDISC